MGYYCKSLIIFAVIAMLLPFFSDIGYHLSLFRFWPLDVCPKQLWPRGGWLLQRDGRFCWGVSTGTYQWYTSSVEHRHVHTYLQYLPCLKVCCLKPQIPIWARCTCSEPHVTVQISTACHVLVVTVRLNMNEVMVHELWLLQLLLLLLLTAPQMQHASLFFYF